MSGFTFVLHKLKVGNLEESVKYCLVLPAAGLLSPKVPCMPSAAKPHHPTLTLTNCVTMDICVSQFLHQKNDD